MNVDVANHIHKHDRFKVVKHAWKYEDFAFITIECKGFTMYFDMEYEDALDSLISAATEARDNFKMLKK